MRRRSSAALSRLSGLPCSALRCAAGPWALCLGSVLLSLRDLSKKSQAPHPETGHLYLGLLRLSPASPALEERHRPSFSLANLLQRPGLHRLRLRLRLHGLHGLHLPRLKCLLHLRNLRGETPRALAESTSAPRCPFQADVSELGRWRVSVPVQVRWAGVPVSNHSTAHRCTQRTPQAGSRRSKLAPNPWSWSPRRAICGCELHRWTAAFH